MKEIKKFYVIYQVTNNVNGKIYIGKHITNDLEDDYMGSGKILAKAKEKYGLENFTFKVLMYLQNEEEMNLLEHCVVTQDFCNRDDVYNIMEGGNGGWSYCNLTGKRVSIEKQYKDIKKMAEHTKQTVANFSQQKKDLIRQKISKGLKETYLKNGSFWSGRHHTAETKQKMRKPHLTSRGSGNSQYGTMWICNDSTKENKKILKTDLIPDGWRKGRILKK